MVGPLAGVAAGAGISVVSGLIPRLEGFAPLPSSAAKAFMVGQSTEMMLTAGAAWAWGQRLVKALSNEAFNELNGRKLVDIKGAPITDQLIQESVKDGLWKLIEPQLKSLQAKFVEEIQKSGSLQDEIMKKAFEIEMKKVEYNYKLFKEIPKEYWEMITNDLSGGNRPDAGKPPTFELTEEEKEKVRDKINPPKTETPIPKEPVKETPPFELDKNQKVTIHMNLYKLNTERPAYPSTQTVQMSWNDLENLYQSYQQWYNRYLREYNNTNDQGSKDNYRFHANKGYHNMQQCRQGQTAIKSYLANKWYYDHR